MSPIHRRLGAQNSTEGSPLGLRPPSEISVKPALFTLSRLRLPADLGNTVLLQVWEGVTGSPCLTARQSGSLGEQLEGGTSTAARSRRLDLEPKELSFLWKQKARVPTKAHLPADSSEAPHRTGYFPHTEARGREPRHGQTQQPQVSP